MKQAADCIIIGGGPAGLQAAGRLAQAGYHATVLEKEETVGGKLNKWDKLFPDFYDASMPTTTSASNATPTGPVKPISKPMMPLTNASGNTPNRKIPTTIILIS